MKQDYTRLAFVLIISVFFGLIFGNVFLFLSMSLLLYVLWQIRVLNNLLQWIKNGKSQEPPDVSGLNDEILNQYENLKIRHKKRKKKLTSYLKRFKETTQALPDAIIVLGENNEIEWANSKAELYLGINHSLDKGQRINNLIRHPNLANFLNQKKKSFFGTERSLDLISHINSDLHLEIRLVSFGKTGRLLVARDITKIHKINKMRSDFIANASHELRTPLTVISGYLESFEDEFSEKELIEEGRRVTKMRTQAERMRRLIEDLLNLSSLETNEEPRHTEPVKIPDIITNIINEARAISGIVSHKFNTELDDELWMKGDRGQIYSAISNIVFNAVQHTPDLGNITIKWCLINNEGVLEVIDTGEGISPENIPRITERFFRVDSGRSREKGGTGLGLAIVKHILVNHKSRLEVESTLGKGSVFRFRIPNSLIIQKDIIDNIKPVIVEFIKN
ncbi:MAG: phosphate regulon sensor histidine kinase PhoR [Gammaproteobacteria bacterium]